MHKFCGFLLFVALLLTACETTTTIANNLNERDANEIVVLLRSREVEALKIAAPVSSTGGASTQQLWNIAVPGNQVTNALAILNQAGLPRVRGTNLLDLFGSQGLVPSELQNQIRYQEGLSEQLANTIRTMDGVIDAFVQITFPKEDEENVKLTASVYVKHRGVLDNPNSLMITKIKRLISSAIPNLQTENVSVVADRALYADITLDSLNESMEKEYVSIWGVTVARESVALFRTILYLFIIALFLLACATIWLAWKSHKVLKYNGLRAFFHQEPYAYEQLEVAEEKEEPIEGEEA